MLAYGYSDEMSLEKNQNQQILSAMHGEYTEFKTADLRSLIIIFHDNLASTSPSLELISKADVWLNRYEHGYAYGRHIVNACLNAIRTKKEKLIYPRTFILISKSKNPNKNTDKKSKKSKKKMPNISVVGFK
jgi:hypothetical protein